jgi:hypothetical protein
MSKGLLENVGAFMRYQPASSPRAARNGRLFGQIVILLLTWGVAGYILYRSRELLYTLALTIYYAPRMLMMWPELTIPEDVKTAFYGLFMYLSVMSVIIAAIFIWGHYSVKKIDHDDAEAMRNIKVEMTAAINQDIKAVRISWWINPKDTVRGIENDMRLLGFRCGIYLPYSQEQAKTIYQLIVNEFITRGHGIHDTMHQGFRVEPVPPGETSNFVFFVEGEHTFREGLFLQHKYSKIIYGRMTTVHVFMPSAPLVAEAELAPFRKRREQAQIELETTALERRTAEEQRKIREIQEKKTEAEEAADRVLKGMNISIRRTEAAIIAHKKFKRMLAKIERDESLTHEDKKDAIEFATKDFTDSMHRIRGLS